MLEKGAMGGGRHYISSIRQKAREDDRQQKAAQRRAEGMAEENEDDVLPDQCFRLPRL